MELTIKLEDEKKLKALKAFLSCLEIPFKAKKKEKPLSPKLIEDIERGRADIKAGRAYKVTLKDLWNEEAWEKVK